MGLSRRVGQLELEVEATQQAHQATRASLARAQQEQVEGEAQASAMAEAQRQILELQVGLDAASKQLLLLPDAEARAAKSDELQKEVGQERDARKRLDEQLKQLSAKQADAAAAAAADLKAASGKIKSLEGELLAKEAGLQAATREAATSREALAVAQSEAVRNVEQVEDEVMRRSCLNFRQQAEEERKQKAAAQALLDVARMRNVELEREQAEHLNVTSKFCLARFFPFARIWAFVGQWELKRVASNALRERQWESSIPKLEHLWRPQRESGNPNSSV